MIRGEFYLEGRGRQTNPTSNPKLRREQHKHKRTVATDQLFLNSLQGSGSFGLVPPLNRLLARGAVFGATGPHPPSRPEHKCSSVSARQVAAVPTPTQDEGFRVHAGMVRILEYMAMASSLSETGVVFSKKEGLLPQRNLVPSARASTVACPSLHLDHQCSCCVAKKG